MLRRLPRWEGLLTLCYHRIGSASDSSWEGMYDGTLEELDARLGFLAKHADVIGPDQIGDVLGRPGRHVLVTFDDGYREWARPVLPLLASHGVRACFFISTGFIDRPRPPWWYELPWMIRASPLDGVPAGPWLDGPVSFDTPGREGAAEVVRERYKSLPGDEAEAFVEWLAEASEAGRAPTEAANGEWLTWDMIRELRDAGMEIGGHTVDHPVLARQSADEQRRQVEECRVRLEEEVGEPIRLFAYPVGLEDSYDDRTLAALSEAGVEYAFSYHGGYVRAGGSWDPLALPRVTGGMNPAIFKAALTLPRMFARW